MKCGLVPVDKFVSRRFAGVIILLMALLFPACAHQARVVYPATPAGDALRQLYTAPSSKALQIAASTTNQFQDPGTRKTLEPVILSIIAQDDSSNAVALAWMLTEWNPRIGATALEFRHLVPALARGLRRGNNPGNDTYISGQVSVFLLIRMNRDDAWSIRKDIYAAFNAPVASPIEGESTECWTRYGLAHMIACFGSDGVPALVRGLDHKDPWVRTCALEAFGMKGIGEALGNWRVPDDQMAANASVGRAAAPKVAERLWDSNPGVRTMAVRAVGALYTPATLTPRVRDRLLELVRDSQTNYPACEAMAALHPAFTPLMLNALIAPGDPNHPYAGHVLWLIGRPVVPDLIARLADAPDFDSRDSLPPQTLRGTLKEIGIKALPDLIEAAAHGANPLTRVRAGICRDEIVQSARAAITRNVSRLEEPNPDHSLPNVTQRLDRIIFFRRYAPLAAEAIPALQNLAQNDADPEVRATAQTVIDQIVREKIDLP